LDRTKYETDVVLTPEQIASAPKAVCEWLRGIFGDDERFESSFVLERHGAMSSGDGLAICTPAEINQLLHHLRDDLLSCEILFELGCDYYDPLTGERRERTIKLTDFLHHTDAKDIFEVERCLKRIDEPLRRLRNDPDATICRQDGQGGFRVHRTTQHVIYQFWRRLVRLTSRRHATETPEGQSKSGPAEAA
jgi:hypothetical protein